jgi:uncharacterized membrane protein YebE (DUF533 family)
MAGVAAGVTAIAAVAGTGYSIYSAQQAAGKGPKPPTLPVERPLPKVTSYATDVQKSQLLAMSAGGTILSDQEKNRQIGNQPGAPTKTLIGT